MCVRACAGMMGMGPGRVVFASVSIVSVMWEGGLPVLACRTHITHHSSCGLSLITHHSSCGLRLIKVMVVFALLAVAGSSQSFAFLVCFPCLLMPACLPVMASGLMQQNPGLMSNVLAQHNDILRAAKWDNCGHLVETEGDSFVILFHEAADAAAFCLQVGGRQAGSSWVGRLIR